MDFQQIFTVCPAIKVNLATLKIFGQNPGILPNLNVVVHLIKTATGLPACHIRLFVIMNIFFIFYYLEGGQDVLVYFYPPERKIIKCSLCVHAWTGGCVDVSQCVT